jgi:hypothetical protein
MSPASATVYLHRSGLSGVVLSAAGESGRSDTANRLVETTQSGNIMTLSVREGPGDRVAGGDQGQAVPVDLVIAAAASSSALSGHPLTPRGARPVTR